MSAATEVRMADRPKYARLLAYPEVGALVGALAVFVIFMAVAPAFRNFANTGTILYQASVIGIMAVPVALLMIGGEFDLSAGVAVFTSAIAGSLLTWYWNFNVWVGVFLALAVSLAIGLFNAILLIKTKLPSFLVTLGTFFILQGINLAVTRYIVGDVTSAKIDDMAGFDSAAAVFGAEWNIGPVNVRVTMLMWLALTIFAAVLLTKTQFGNWVFAVGGDADAARAVGVPVDRVKILLYLFVGFCAWMLGMHQVLFNGRVQTGQGVGDEFIFIIAAVVGGCLMTGGYGSVIGASLGALIYGMVKLGINYAGWDPDWLMTVLGVMLVGATIVNTWVRREAEKL